MTSTHPPDLAALIGIDWADTHHDISLQATDGSPVESRRIAHTPAALAEWLAGLSRRFGGRPVGVAVETSRGPLIHALLEQAFIVLYPVNPRSLKRFRQAFTPSGAKDDASDADLLRDLLAKHRDRLPAWRPDTPATRALQRLTQQRRSLVDQGTQFTQQLTAVLKEYFPQALDWCGELRDPLAGDFLRRWPTLEALQRARPQTVRRFYHAHHCRGAARIDARIEAIRHAVPLTRDPAILAPAVLLVQALVAQLAALRESVARFDAEIAERFAAHEDAPLFAALPGSGEVLAPRILVAFGTDRSRFPAAQDVQEATGIAPVTVRSGNQTAVHRRWAAPTFTRQTFHEFARQSIHRCAWARAYYETQRARGKSHHTALRALAFKWIRILWACWYHRTPYDDAAYTRALQRRGSPLAARIAAA